MLRAMVEGWMVRHMHRSRLRQLQEYIELCPCLVICLIASGFRLAARQQCCGGRLVGVDLLQFGQSRRCPWLRGRPSCPSVHLVRGRQETAR